MNILFRIRVKPISNLFSISLNGKVSVRSEKTFSGTICLNKSVKKFVL